MKNSTLKRREVLKIAGAAGSVAVTGSASAERTSESVRLVEVGIEYELPERYDYRRFHDDSSALYNVDRERRILTPAFDAPARVRRLLKENDVLVRGSRLTTMPAKVGSVRPTTTVPIKLGSRKRPYEHVSLKEPVKLPVVDLQRANGNVVLNVEGLTETLNPESNIEHKLTRRQLNVRTAQVTDETVEVEGVPEYKWGPRMEFNSVLVEAVPKVTVEDFGELSVSQLNV